MGRDSLRVVGLLLWLTGCGQVVAVKLPTRDANVNANYTCTPSSSAPTFDCRSQRTFHQYDRELGVDKKTCPFGVANVYVETNWHGGVSRIQYTCALAGVGGFPNEEGTP